MDKLIPTVNKLQDVFNTVGQNEIDLPQIVVVGSQSSGKSSVLENLVGRDFLPRGSGIVTRRPLVLQLVNVPRAEDGSAKDNDLVRAQFLHLPNKVFTDMNEVRREIERETERLAGSNKGIVKTPIHLRISSPDVLSLTLVDLPGITKIPVGDQPSDIETQTRSLVFEYISKPNSIIVAISPANVDIVNSESLKFAREVDPKGSRTIGVITKIDLMDRGTNSLDILTGRVYPLRLGFVGVVNRSQEDTQSNKPISDSLKFESEFFVYRTIQQHCGTANLAKVLNQLLMQHIRDHLPSIKTKINALISQTEQELSSYGRMSAENDKVSNAGRLLKLITLFATEGTASEMSTVELCGGARLYYIFNDIFASGLDSVNPANNLTNHDIRTAIRNSTGPRASLFVPEIAFQLLVKPQIKSLEPPAQRCVQLAYEELMKIGLSCGNNEMRRYPRLHAKVMEVVSDLLRERVGPTADYIESLIAIERAYINTNHPDFIGGPGAIDDLQRKLERKRKDNARARVRDVGKNAKSAHQRSIDVDTVIVSSNGATDEYVDSTIVDTAEIDDRVDSHRRKSSISANIHALRGPGSGSPIGSVASAGGPTNGKFFNSFFGAGGRRDGLHVSADEPRAGHASVIPNLAGEGTSFDDEVAALSAQMSTDLNTADQRDEMETTLIRSLIASYFSIVRKSIQDLVPKAIMHLLVNEVCQNMQNRLVEELYMEPLTTELLQEDPALVAERDQCAAMLGVYKKAFAIINESM
ncbi:Dynamin central region-domain-containing protein [Kickxella alabastrina]|uniref:Dynamin central region-domain-containing protein n=1 Tax=Kickxella alabastrina TaxID=61397 RepID=UPI0022209F24|nr:Dynamin central region-domain-containing protein [Kickxella alabastrina]KAI7826464.1 Dynamin central region-domain-containing protein [Kickxella alabastrina]